MTGEINPELVKAVAAYFATQIQQRGDNTEFIPEMSILNIAAFEKTFSPYIGKITDANISVQGPQLLAIYTNIAKRAGLKIAIFNARVGENVSQTNTDTYYDMDYSVEGTHTEADVRKRLAKAAQEVAQMTPDKIKEFMSNPTVVPYKTILDPSLNNTPTPTTAPQVRYQLHKDTPKAEIDPSLNVAPVPTTKAVIDTELAPPPPVKYKLHHHEGDPLPPNLKNTGGKLQK